MKYLIKYTLLVSVLLTVVGCSKDDLPEESESPYLNYETKTALELPFNEEWWVFWGGRDVADNYHAAHPIQRFAIDLVIKVDGESHTGSGSQKRRVSLLWKESECSW